MKKIELLAPAKDKECAVIAIDYGADALYIGACSFGARKNASNSLEDIKEIVNYAHKFGVKVYVTINTIMNDNELSQAVKLIEELYKINIDAIIIQDMGLLECDLPPIKLNASTQCDNRTLEKVNFLGNSGFDRVILARELNLEEIKNICNNANTEIETFIHGSLCVSYSGQCYLSQSIGKRSANRGECAQPCRKLYSLKDEKGNILIKNKHLLCLKDFNASNELKELIEAGVCSFKIEGRLKDKNYIKNVVSYYRKKLDSIIKPEQRSSYGSCEIDFEPDVSKSFNRGFTNYFLKGRNADIYNFDTPKSIGEAIGTVFDIKNTYFTMKNGAKVLNNGDGICFLTKNGLEGINIDKVENGKIFVKNTQKITKNTQIFRNFDRIFEKKLQNSHKKRQISTKILLKNEKNELIFSAETKNCSVKLIIKNNFEPAKNETKMLENIEKSMGKSAETEFLIEKIEINLEKVPFIAISELNNIRRSLLEKLSAENLKNYTVEKRTKPIKNIPYIQSQLDFRGNVLNKKAKEFYEKRKTKIIENALETNINPTGKEIMTCKHCLLYSIGKCKKLTKNNTKYFLTDEKNKDYELIFDCQNCQMKIIY